MARGQGGLAILTQPDWSAGGERDVAPHLIDDRGFLEGTNVLLDNDGLPYKRGGSVAKSNAAFGASLRFVWEGYLAAGRRTLVASTADFGVLDDDDATVLNLGGAGLSEPLRARQIGGVVFVGGYIYGGSLLSANYSTGTVTIATGATTLAGAGTSWTSNVDAGMLMQFGDERVYVVDSVTDDTHLVLADPYEGPNHLGAASPTFRPLYTITTADPYYSSKLYAVGGGRLFVAIDPNVVRFTSIDLTTGHSEPHNFDDDDYHNVPEGAQILGLEALGGELLIFTSQGIWALQNIAYNLVDELGNPQQTLSQASGDLILWGNAGIAHFQDAVVAPCLDGVYVIDGRSEPRNVGKGIRRLYRRYVDLGYKPGGAVTYRNHYFLPILNSINQWVDTLVCRLDRPVRSRGQTLWPWTQLSDAGGHCSAYAVRSAGVQSGTGEPPALLGASIDDDAVLLDLTDFFEPSGDNSLDHDGNAPSFALVTRDYPTSDGGIGRLRKAALLYEMFASDEEADPQIYLDLGLGSLDASEPPQWDEVLWDEFQWASDSEVGGFEALEGSFGPDPGVNKAVWMARRRAPYVRFRIRSSDPVAKLTLRTLEVGVIPSGGNRLSRVQDAGS